jgi:hypothetical protein
LKIKLLVLNNIFIIALKVRHIMIFCSTWIHWRVGWPIRVLFIDNFPKLINIGAILALRLIIIFSHCLKMFIIIICTNKFIKVFWMDLTWLIFCVHCFLKNLKLHLFILNVFLNFIKLIFLENLRVVNFAWSFIFFKNCFNIVCLNLIF